MIFNPFHAVLAALPCETWASDRGLGIQWRLGEHRSAGLQLDICSASQAVSLKWWWGERAGHVHGLAVADALVFLFPSGSIHTTRFALCDRAADRRRLGGATWLWSQPAIDTVLVGRLCAVLITAAEEEKAYRAHMATRKQATEGAAAVQ